MRATLRGEADAVLRFVLWWILVPTAGVVILLVGLLVLLVECEPTVLILPPPAMPGPP